MKRILCVVPVLLVAMFYIGPASASSNDSMNNVTAICIELNQEINGWLPLLRSALTSEVGGEFQENEIQRHLQKLLPMMEMAERLGCEMKYE